MAASPSRTVLGQVSGRVPIASQQGAPAEGAAVDPAGLGTWPALRGTAPAGDVRRGLLWAGPSPRTGLASRQRSPRAVRSREGLGASPSAAAPHPALCAALDLASQEKQRLEDKQREARRERAREGAEWQTR